MFTKQHYEAVASSLNNAYKSIKGVEGDTFWLVFNKLTDMFVKDNPNFDKEKFGDKVIKTVNK